MANKKRKNTPGTQKKGAKAKAAAATTTTITIGSSKSTQPTSGSKGKSSRGSDRDRVGGRNQRVFDSFPLHLVPDNEYAGKDHNRELRELCKGKVWVIPSFFSHKECRTWIEFCESFGDNDGNGNGNNNGGGGGGGGGGFQYTSLPGSKYMANRECYRLQQENAVELSERIFQRLRKLTLSNDHSDNGEPTSILSRLQSETADLYPCNSDYNCNCNFNYNYKPIHCNPNIRVYRYDEGHSFGKHVDGSDVVPGCGTTEMTMLVYLSACRGGATRFHRGSGRRASSFAFEPEIGALLLHVHGKHCLEHEADMVMGGQKYVLRTDLVYGNQ